MTVPRTIDGVAAPSAAAAATSLRARGLRLSAARRLLLGALFAAEAPLTAEQLAGEGDVASTYRNLDVLEHLGLVHHVHLGHGAGLYEPAGAAHDFVVCERCGSHLALAPDVLAGVRAAVRAATGYAPRFTHFPLSGLCPACDERTC